MTAELLRPHAEQVYAAELDALARADEKPRPPSWRLSPQAVVTYLLGGVLADGTLVIPKYVGPRRLIEVAVATLATDRALLLLGVPGTAKTWVSEHLAAAISGDSTLLVQGTSGTAEETIRYGWNYARLLAEGPSEQYEGGDEAQMRARLGALRSAGVRVVALLALSDDSAPSYDAANAAALASLGIPAFACTPDAFPDLIAQAINGGDIAAWAQREDLAAR